MAVTFSWWTAQAVCNLLQMLKARMATRSLWDFHNSTLQNMPLALLYHHSTMVTWCRSLRMAQRPRCTWIGYVVTKKAARRPSNALTTCPSQAQLIWFMAFSSGSRSLCNSRSQMTNAAITHNTCAPRVAQTDCSEHSSYLCFFLCFVISSRLRVCIMWVSLPPGLCAPTGCRTIE